jgi:hypothetical protein
MRYQRPRLRRGSAEPINILIGINDQLDGSKKGLRLAAKSGVSTPEVRLHIAPTRLNSRHSIALIYPIHTTMACPSCSFARTFARRTAIPSLPVKRTYATAPTALQQSGTPSTPTEQPTSAAGTPLLHITKSKIRHHPSNPNARPPPPSHSSITRLLGVRFSRPVPGAQEWITSTYSYNKGAVKTLPTAAHTTNDLLEHYSVLRNTGGKPSSRTAIAGRRKNPDRVYVSKAGVKDFGDKIRIDAYVYDEGKASADALAKRLLAKEARTTRSSGGAGGAGGARGGRSRAPGGRGPAPQ